MSRFARSVLPGFVLLLLGTALFASPASSFPVTPQQQGAIEATFGEGAPFGTYQIRTETNRLYLTSASTAGEETPPGIAQGTPSGAGLTMVRPTGVLGPGLCSDVDLVGLTDGEPCTQIDAMVDADPDDKQTLIATPRAIASKQLVAVSVANPAALTATFPLAPVLDDVRIFRIDVRIYAACAVAGLDPGGALPGNYQSGRFTFQAVLREQKLDGDTWVDDESPLTGNPNSNMRLRPDGGGNSPLYIQPYIGGADLGNPVLGDGGRLIEKGHRLALTLNLNDVDNTGFPTDAACVIHYDSTGFPSQVRVQDNGARLAMFTEDRFGNEVVGFPAGDSTDSLSRRVRVQVVQASPWPDATDQLLSKRANLRLLDVPTNQFLYYVDNLDGSQNAFLERDIRTMELIERTDQAIGPSVIRRTFEFAYGSNQPDTQVQPVLYAFDHRASDNFNHNLQWEFSGPTFRLGGKGIAISLAQGERINHLVNRLEPTIYSILVQNIGTEDDVVSLTVSEPGEGWKARVLGGGLVFLAAGKSIIEQVEVTPPASAANGAAKAVLVRASSSFSDVDDPAPLTLTTTVTTTVTRAVDLVASSSLVQVRPTVTKAFSFTVVNNGTSRDDFVLTPSVPANVVGWTIQMNPTSLQVPAGGRTQVQALITAPAEVATGATFPLTLRVQEVGNAAISDSLVVTVQVFERVGVLAGLLDPSTNRTLREFNWAGNCVDGFDPLCLSAEADFGVAVEDTDYDSTALFRIPVTNLGDRVQDYRVEAFWDQTVNGGFTDSVTCETSFLNSGVLGSAGDRSDGIPDGWRFNYGATLGQPLPSARQFGVGQFGVDVSNAGFSGRYQLNGTPSAAFPDLKPLTLQPGETKMLLLEMGYLTGDVCPGNNNGSGLLGADRVTAAARNKAAMTFVVTNLEDTSLRSSVALPVTVTPMGDFLGTNVYSGGIHNVGIGLANKELADKKGLVGAPIVFDLTAYNSGNDHDDLILSVDEPEPGWSHQLAVTGSIPPGVVTCDAPINNGRTIRCPRAGVFDEVTFQVIATPGPTVQVGDLDDITVAVRSGDASQISKSLPLTATATGTFFFDAHGLGLNSRNAVRNAPTSFPFVIENKGTSSDTYRLSLLVSDPTWRPTFSGGTTVVVPPGLDYAGFLTVTPPAAATGAQQFRVLVESLGNGAKDPFDLFATPVAAGALTLSGQPAQDILIAQRGTPTNVTVKAVQSTGSGAQITFTPDQAALPPGWTVTPATRTATLAAPSGGGSPEATATFQVVAPANALSDSRGLLKVTGTTAHATPLTAATDIVLNVASTFGLRITPEGLANQTIAPGGDLLFNLTVKNLGLGTDTVALTHTTLPNGWTLLFNPPILSLGPLESKALTAKVSAPATATPGNEASIVVFATSIGDPTKIASQPLKAVIGFNALRIQPVAATLAGAPQETLAFVLNITNTGTLPDDFVGSTVVLTTPLRSHVTLAAPQSRFQLDPGQSVQGVLNVRLGDDIPSGSTLQFNVTVRSLVDQRQQVATASTVVTAEVLRYVSGDLNGDGIKEYAVDRNKDAGDGFEEFRPSSTPGGRPLAEPDLRVFLRDDARAALSRDVTLPNGTIVRAVVLVIDGDGDGKVDHFLDADGDNLPDYYTDPDDAKGSRIDFRKDVNGDQVPELFVDAQGNGAIDAVYDLTRGTFTKVLQVDIDNDGQLDYVVDRDGDGQADQDETVLYTRTGFLLIVQKVDVDGDGRLDQVFDTDGDGNPDYFIPAGSTVAIPIVMRDVNGDGVQDWTFDGDGDGRRESYYDPATGRAHVIDSAGHFLDALQKYWYIGALFALVIVLFVALVAVTRR